jgi:hypothetical protein
MVPTAYNGTFTITGVTANTFTFTMVVNPGATTTTGTVVNSIASATHSGTTATITTAAAHGLVAGQNVTIAGASPSGFNGTVLILNTPTPTTFTYTLVTNPFPVINPTVLGAISNPIVGATWGSSLGGTATITTGFAHGFSVGQQVTIAGMTPTGFNGTFVITSVNSLNQFRYALAVDPGTGILFGSVNIVPTAPGVWRYDSSGKWVNLTAVVSTTRASVKGAFTGTAAPKTPGPDDNYTIAFPQSNANWSDISLSSGILYAALANPTVNTAANGVYRLKEPDRDSPTLPFYWLAGDAINGPDNRNATYVNAPDPAMTNFPAATNIKISAVGAPVNEVQTITVNTSAAAVTSFQLTYNGTVLTPVIPNSGNVRQAISDALNNSTILGQWITFDGNDGVTVQQTTFGTVSTYTLTFNGNSVAGANVSQIGVTNVVAASG